MAQEAQKIPAPKRRKRNKIGSSWRKMLILLLFAVGSFVIMAIGILPKQVNYVAGAPAAEDVFYTKATTSYTSQLRTEEAKAAAAAEVEPVYSIDTTVTDSILESVDASFTAIDRVRNELAAEEEPNIADKLPQLRDDLPGTFSDELLTYVLNTSRAELISLRQTLRNAILATYEKGVREDSQGLLNAKAEISAAVEAAGLGEQGTQFLLYYLDASAFPANEHYNAVATQVAVEEAQDAVPAQTVTVQSGERLVTRGTVVTEEQIEKLQALGMYSETANYLAYVGLAAMVIIAYILLGLYLNNYQKKIFARNNMVVLLGVIMVLLVLLCKLIAWIGTAANSDFMDQIGYLMPVAAASMLIAVLLGRNLAIFATIVLGLFTGIICDGSLSFALVAIGGGLAGILSTMRLNQRSQFVGASIYIALVNVLLVGAWGTLYNQSYSAIGVGSLFGLINGFLAAILAMGLLPFLETAFSVTTEVRLLELANSNHPLLKRLMVEAPGTYNHSILVGNLAEAAADAIDADALLVRVASYYHDIGKLKRPYFFIENQSLGDNPHDKLQPALSAMILSSHVKDGVEMLKEQKFPQEIIDLVEQHHGTSLMQYFYHKAMEQAVDKDSVREEDFRYPFHKPQTKEAALVHLADSVQAGVQSIKNPVKGQIEEMVQNVIKGKMEDGQLQECPLTFQDLDKITHAFLTVLSGVNHSRIVYPDQVAKEVGGSIDARLLDATKTGLAGANTAAGEEVTQPSSPADAAKSLPLDSNS